MACSVPVLLLAFNRPEQTRQVLEQIRLVAPIKLYAHCDGPRPDVPADKAKIAEVQQLIESIGSSATTSLKTLFRTENQGLRKGVYGALNWFFEQEEYGIILEDDCVPDPSMFPFCSELLLKYRYDERIMHIGCSNLASGMQPAISGSYVFSKFSFVWGWASWRRAWKKMLIDLDGLDTFERYSEMQRFLPDTKAGVYMLDKFRQTRAGKNNSWAYAWFYTILKNKGFCIVPKINLVQNKGVGAEGATNTTKQNKQAQREANAISFPLIHPEEVRTNKKRELQFFYTSQKSRFRLWLWFLLHKLGLR